MRIFFGLPTETRTERGGSGIRHRDSAIGTRDSALPSPRRVRSPDGRVPKLTASPPAPESASRAPYLGESRWLARAAWRSGGRVGRGRSREPDAPQFSYPEQWRVFARRAVGS